MDVKEFRKAAYLVVDAIADYYEQLDSIPVEHQVKVGYLAKLLPAEAPEDPEPFDIINSDFHKLIMPGVTHWQSGNFFAYYPCNSSFPAMLAEMYSNMINAQGFSWDTCPAMSELETVATDWLAKLIGLPADFHSNSKGCGSIQGSASEAVLVTMVAARDRTLRNNPTQPSKLVVYCSDQTHTSTRKAAQILGLTMKVIKSDELGQLRASALLYQLENDIREGLVPFYLVVSLGTTGICVSDPIKELALAAGPYSLWLHVDAAYAGSALILPEFRDIHIKGISLCDSFNFNPHKWLQVNFDCSALWVKDRSALVLALSADAAFFKKVIEDGTLAVDFKDLQIPLGRRFRSLKLWFALRSFGAKKLRGMIREHIDLTDKLLSLIQADGLFCIVLPKHHLTLLPLQVTPLSSDEPLEMVNERTKYCAHILDVDPSISITTATFKGKFIIRINIGSPQTKYSHVASLYAKMKSAALLAREKKLSVNK
ncbi:hypothetical protein DSO57_1025702 [Entomophthora muscae]|uniref:Uncharacterized protein n=1 Tax=Entomophthora muscae TaxID=34485 RepID=A0ACC2TDG7_9FUNG|nr:hypothetical protein DSO57_1025702 [Entomophthora muscae]